MRIIVAPWFPFEVTCQETGGTFTCHCVCALIGGEEVLLVSQLLFDRLKAEIPGDALAAAVIALTEEIAKLKEREYEIAKDAVATAMKIAAERDAAIAERDGAWRALGRGPGEDDAGHVETLAQAITAARERLGGAAA